MALVGSLFSNYYVPPIVFSALARFHPNCTYPNYNSAVKRKDDGSEIRVCIDGKQRLTSIHRFMLGEIASACCCILFQRTPLIFFP